MAEHRSRWFPIGLRADLDHAIESGLSYELRGVRALEARDFKAAEEFFRKGVQLAPGNTALGRSLRHKLGTALVLQGDVAGAMARFEEIAKLAPADGLDEACRESQLQPRRARWPSSGRSQEAISG